MNQWQLSVGTFETFIRRYSALSAERDRDVVPTFTVQLNNLLYGWQ